MQSFNLIEMMICVAIIAILAAVALPAYQAYVEDERNQPRQVEEIVVDFPAKIYRGRYYVTNYVSYIKGGRKMNQTITCFLDVAYIEYQEFTALIDPNGLPVLCNLPEGYIEPELQ